MLSSQCDHDCLEGSTHASSCRSPFMGSVANAVKMVQRYSSGLSDRNAALGRFDNNLRVCSAKCCLAAGYIARILGQASQLSGELHFVDVTAPHWVASGCLSRSL
jgi:hypothetical protein